MSKARTFCQQLLASMRCDPALFDEPGVTIAGHPDRAESRVSSGYTLGEHFVVTCDPAVESMLTEASNGMDPTLDSFTELANELGAQFLGSGRMQLRESDEVHRPALPPGYEYRTLHNTDEQSLTLISNLIDDSSEDDLDEAELELDNLDDVIEVIIAPTGEIAAYASSQPFDLATGYGDIGVITHHAHRRSRLGSAVVQSLAIRQHELGVEPLYRCDEDNTASVRMSATLEFVPATQLRAYRFEV